MFFFPEKLSNYNKLDLSERNEKSVKRDGISILVDTVCSHSLFHRELERPISDINLANKVYSADKKIAIICFVENVGQEKKIAFLRFLKMTNCEVEVNRLYFPPLQLA